MKPKPDLAAAARQVREIYAEWRRRPLERHCADLADCCRFRQTGRTPYLTRGEALVAARAWRAAGSKEIVTPADGSCPFLHPSSGKCRIYDGRPFGCRSHFCAAAGGPANPTSRTGGICGAESPHFATSRQKGRHYRICSI